MTMNDNLPELRDIHLPDGVSIFPPAYGWYVIIGIVLILCFSWKLYGLWRLKSRKLYANRFLARLDTQNVTMSAIQVSELLRRICVYRYPQAVALSGSDWLNFLYAHCHHTLTPEAAQLLQNAPFINPQTSTYTTQNLQELINFTRRWIGENL